jgi:hypothetical protein
MEALDGERLLHAHQALAGVEIHVVDLLARRLRL